MARGTQNKSSINYAIASNTIVLVLIGFFLLLYFHTNSITNIVKEQINILVELEDNLPENKIKALQNTIAANDAVVSDKVQFIPSSEASTLMGIQIDSASLGNPFRDIISFNVSSQSYDSDILSEIKSELIGKEGIHDVFYENVLIDNVKSNLKKLSFGILILSIIFAILVMVIIYNTINLSLYADRWEIKTMEIIGARDSFIRQPYIKIAGRIALTSFGIAALLLIFLITFILYSFEDTSAIIQWIFVLLTFIIMFGLSILITFTATIKIVNKYLYTSEEDMYQ